MNRRNLFVLLAIIATALCTTEVVRYERQQKRRFTSEVHQVMRQRIDLQHVLIGLDNFVLDNPTVLNGVSAVGDYSEIQMLEMIRTNKNGDDLLRWLNQGRDLTDVWGHPLRFHFEAVDVLHGKAKVVIWSVGPNGVDERGRGDDEVASSEIGNTR